MADTDILRAYKAKSYPVVQGGVPVYTTGELRQIEQSVGLIIEVMKTLEARKTPVTLTAAPTTSDLSAGRWNLFKNSTSGAVVIAYNDAGTIKSVALT